MTLHEIRTHLAPREVIDRAEWYFTHEGSPAAASPNRVGDGWLRLFLEVGEITIAALPDGDGTRVRASASRSGHLLGRFVASLAPAHDAVRTTNRHRVHRSSAALVESYVDAPTLAAGEASVEVKAA
ncbi:MAG TPA: hypothetical protein VFL93_03835 [Longimicrobiaceae bacterium]|nr:hypothetical protein [Longimicrobiaceae bacterium]